MSCVVRTKYWDLKTNLNTKSKIVINFWRPYNNIPYICIFWTLENFPWAAEDIDGEIEKEEEIEGEPEPEYENVAVEELFSFVRQTGLSENENICSRLVVSSPHPGKNIS